MKSIIKRSLAVILFALIISGYIFILACCNDDPAIQYTPPSQSAVQTTSDTESISSPQTESPSLESKDTAQTESDREYSKNY